MDRCLILIELAKKGAVGGEVAITVRNVASLMNVSAQTALRWLSKLEKEGLIERRVKGRRTLLRLTEKGLKFLEDVHDSLEVVLYKGVIIGEVVSGLGEGAYYVRQYSERFEEYLGFKPYPGTLNVKVLFPRTIFDALCNVKPIIIPGFIKDGRSFGDVRAYPILIDDVEGAVVMPSRTVHPPGIAEVISPVCIRETLKVNDGDKIILRAHGGE